MSIERALDELTVALQKAGAAPPREARAEQLAAIPEVEAAVAPLSLPADLRRMWELIDPLSLAVLTSPELLGPIEALTQRRWETDDFEATIVPAALFPVADTSLRITSIELGGPYGPGGGLFAWSIDDGAIEAIYDSLPAWIDDIAAAIHAGRFERTQWGDRERLLLADTHPPVGRGADRYFERPEHWPDHWLQSSGLSPDDRHPHGTTHTIAEVLRSDPAQELRAVLSGRAVSLVGTGRGVNVTVDDGTGRLSIFCPARVTAFGPSIQGEYEYVISVPPGDRVEVATIPSESKPSSELTESEERELFMHLYTNRPIAIAEAVRPCD